MSPQNGTRLPQKIIPSHKREDVEEEKIKIKREDIKEISLSLWILNAGLNTI